MVRLQRLIDKYVGFFIVLVLGFLKIFDKKPRKRKKILVIKLWAIGDSVLTLTLIKAIKTKFKNSAVDVLTRKRIMSVFQAYENVDCIYNMDNKKQFIKLLFSFRKYDFVFDCEPYLNLSAIFAFVLGKERIGFSNQWRSILYNKSVEFNKKQHMIQNYLDMIRVLGVKYEVEKLEQLKVDNNSKKKVDKYLKNKVKLLVGITPGVAESAKSRMWYENRFAKLSDKLIDELNVEVFFIDGPSNKNVTKKIISMMKNKPVNVVGKFDLTETFYLISKCDIFISNDTGPMHIAAAQRCKTIGLFGPNTPVLWGPYGKDNVAIYKTKLTPSIQNDKGVFPDTNRKEYMGPITVNDVFDAVKKFILK